MKLTNVSVHKCRSKHAFPIFGWIIMIFQGMNPFKKESYQHLAMSYITEHGDLRVCQSTRKLGVHEISYSEFQEQYEVVGSRTFSKQVTIKDYMSWYKSIEGKPYDKWQVVGLAFKALNFISFNTMGSNYRKLICNEVPLNFLEKFENIIVVDSDNYDLINTWEIIECHS